MSDPYLELQSEMFRLIIERRSLPHPTSRAFSQKPWTEAYRTVAEPSERDANLTACAMFFGQQIKSLRRTFENELFFGLCRREALVLSIAIANENQNILNEKVVDELNIWRGKVGRLDAFGKIKVSSPHKGNIASPDTVASTIVDTLPHMLERANKSPARIERSAELNFWERGAKISAVLSIERGLKDLWQQALWEGWRLSRDFRI